MRAAPKDRLELDNARVNRLLRLAADARQCERRGNGVFPSATRQMGRVVKPAPSSVHLSR